MESLDVARFRLVNGHLSGPPAADPVAAVRRHVAVQAQEFAAAKWSLGQRTTGADDAAVQRLVDEGAILRTHALRPTWHFVAAEDLGWIQELTGPRVHVFNGFINRSEGLDDDTLARTGKVIVEALRGGNHLTRKELAEVLDRAGYPATGVKLGYIVMRAELEGVIANGAMRGKQHTYALVAERVGDGRSLSGDEALAELTLRYFTSHGPATVKDFSWWSSLTVTQIRRGLSLVGDALRAEVVDGRMLWFAPGTDPAPTPPPALLLQGYDEYVVAYSDTKSAFNVRGAGFPAGRYAQNTLLHAVMLDGQLAGHWRRIPGGKRIAIEIDLFATPTARQRKAIDAELQRHEAFAGLPLTVTVSPG